MREIRRLDLAGVATLLDWAAAEGWNPGVNDAAAFHAADPNGFIGAFVGDVMVAGIAAVAYDASFGFVGLYICHPDWRGQGHGKAVWDAGMAYLGGRTIGLDGVPEQQANYARMGFVAVYDTIRMTGTLPGRMTDAQDETDLNIIAAFDGTHFPAPRPGFLGHWLALPNRVTTQVAGGSVEAFAVTRRCRDGSKAGPLFATSLTAATAILDAQSGTVHIDVPAYQRDWMDVLTRRGFTPGFTTSRMYRGSPPVLPLDEIFGVTSLELG